MRDGEGREGESEREREKERCAPPMQVSDISAVVIDAFGLQSVISQTGIPIGIPL